MVRRAGEHRDLTGATGAFSAGGGQEDAAFDNRVEEGLVGRYYEYVARGRQFDRDGTVLRRLDMHRGECLNVQVQVTSCSHQCACRVDHSLRAAAVDGRAGFAITDQLLKWQGSRAGLDEF